MPLHLTVLLAYSAFLILLGLWIGRRVRTTGDFFVAGRRLGPGLLFATMLAANIGAGSTVGAAGLGYRDGLSAWWWVGSAGLGSLVLAFWIGPRLRDIAARHEFKTVGDFLEYRYGRTVRGAIAVLLWIGTLAILAGQLIAMAFVLNVVAGIPKAAACLLGGIVMTTYFVAGGLLSSVWVNVVQLTVKLAGFLVALPLALNAAGGWSGVASTTGVTNDYWSFWRGGGSGSIYLAMLGPAFIVSPGLLQKIYGARDNRAVVLGVGGNALVLLTFAFIPPLLGMIARVQHPGLAARDLALPMVLMHDVPPLVGSLGLAALFSAEVSAADAILFMLSTSLSQDLYRRFINPGASDARLLRVARLAGIAGGGLGVALAIVSPSVIDALSVFYTLLTVSLFVPVVAGLLLRRGESPEALASIAAGVTTVMAVQLFTAGRGLGTWTPAMLGLAAATLGFTLVGLARRQAVDAKANLPSDVVSRDAD